MKVYCASSWRNLRQPKVVELLRHEGHEVYDFRHPHIGPGAGGEGFRWDEIDPLWQYWTPAQFRAGLCHPLARDGFTSDRQAMAWADAFVLVLPAGRSAHLEFGWAIGQGKISILAFDPRPNAPDFEPELMYRLADYLCTDDLELLSALENENPARVARSPS